MDFAALDEPSDSSVSACNRFPSEDGKYCRYPNFALVLVHGGHGSPVTLRDS